MPDLDVEELAKRLVACRTLNEEVILVEWPLELLALLALTRASTRLRRRVVPLLLALPLLLRNVTGVTTILDDVIVSSTGEVASSRASADSEEVEEAGVPTSLLLVGAMPDAGGVEGS